MVIGAVAFYLIACLLYAAWLVQHPDFDDIIWSNRFWFYLTMLVADLFLGMTIFVYLFRKMRGDKNKVTELNHSKDIREKVGDDHK